MPTTVADADVALHMDARPLVAEMQKKLGRIMDKVMKNHPVLLNIDDQYMYRRGQKISKELQKILESIKPYVEVDVDKKGFLARIRGFFRTVGAKARLAVPLTVEAGARNFGQDVKGFLKKIVGKTRLAIPVSVEAGARNLAADVARISKNLGRRARLLIPVSLEAGVRDLFDFRSGEGAISRLKRGFSSAGESAAGFFRSVGRGASTAFSTVKSFGEKAGETVGAVFSVLGKLAGPAISAVVLLVGVKLVGALITATALAAGLGAGLVAAFAIAGSAAAVFGLAALPSILKIFKAVSGGNKEIAKLPKGLQVGAKAVVGLKTAFESWSKPFQFFMGKMVAQFANLGSAILPKLTPIVNEMGKAFVYLGERAEKAINGPTFSNFLTMLEKRGPSVFTHLTNAAANFGAGLTNILTSIAPFADSLSGKIEQISQKFRDWTVSAEGQKDIKEFFQWVKDNAPAFASGIKDIGEKLLQMGKDLASKDIGKDLKDIGTAISAIATAINALNWSLNNAKENLQLIKDLLSGKAFSSENKGEFKVPKGKKDPRANQFGGGAIDTTAITEGAKLAFREVEQVASDAWRDISVGASGLAEKVGGGLASLGPKMSSATSTAVDQVQGLLSGGGSRWTGTVAAATNSAAWAWAPIAPRMGQIAWAASGQVSSGLWAGVGMAGSAADEMANRVEDAAAGISDGMFDRGANVGKMVAAGIRSSIPYVAAASDEMADRISSYHPSSPVRRGPLKSLNHGHAGKKIVEMLAGGIESGRESLGKSLTRTMAVPAGVAVGQRANNGRGVTKTTTITKSPQFTVMSPSADPLAVAEAALRRGRTVGAF